MLAITLIAGFPFGTHCASATCPDTLLQRQIAAYAEKILPILDKLLPRPCVWSNGRESASHMEGAGSIPSSSIRKTLKMEPTALCMMLCISNGVMENKPVSHNWKKCRGQLDLDQSVGNWAVKPHLTSEFFLDCNFERF